MKPWSLLHVLPIIGLTSILMGASQAPSPSSDPSYAELLGLLDQGITQLSSSIDGIGKRIAEGSRLPETPDGAMRQLRQLDQSAWQLRQNQWKVQRDHLMFAKDHLLAATKDQHAKPQLLQEWMAHEQQFLSRLEELRQNRLDLERQRFRVEADLIQRYLQ
jgi:hypothetical protein